MERNSTGHLEFSKIMLPKEAAGYVKISASKLAKLRMLANRSEGPAFIKLSGNVLYRREDLDAWISDHVVRHA